VSELTDKVSDAFTDQAMEAFSKATNGALTFDRKTFSDENKRATYLLKFRENSRNDQEASCVVTVGNEEESLIRSTWENVFATARLNGNKLPDAAVKRAMDVIMTGWKQGPKTIDIDYSLIRNSDDEYHVKVTLPPALMAGLHIPTDAAVTISAAVVTAISAAHGQPSTAVRRLCQVRSQERDTSILRIL